MNEAGRPPSLVAVSGTVHCPFRINDEVDHYFATLSDARRWLERAAQVSPYPVSIEAHQAGTWVLIETRPGEDGV